MSQTTESPMKKIILDKVVLNMGVGKSGDVIEIAKRALNQISGKKPNERAARETQRDWGIRKGEPKSCFFLPVNSYDLSFGIILPSLHILLLDNPLLLDL